MLAELGVEDVSELFDIPERVRFDGELDIPARSERAVVDEIDRMFAGNDELTEFLGRGHYDHYVPAIVDALSTRSEFLTSYTQYQPEIAQGFLQALFEYQSMLVELTGLPVANCSMYDAATALAEAALLAGRATGPDRDTVLVPAHLREGKRSVLENYVDGTGLAVETYPMDDGAADVGAVAERVGPGTAMLYAESPSVRGVIEESLGALGRTAGEAGALFCLGSDPVALALLEEPAGVGADVVVGEADTLGLPTADGMGLGMFAVDDRFLRQTPGRLVGTGTDRTGRRAFTLTLQTREQHIRKAGATSNICTNQAWLALRTAIHVAALGPGGLADLAKRCVREAGALAAALDAVDGVTAPVHDRHHFREFAVDVAGATREAGAIAGDLADRGHAVHVLGEGRLQVCVTETTADRTDALVAAFEEVIA